MESSIILTISVTCVFISYLLFRSVSGSLKFRELNLISWVFYYNLIAQSFIASILVALKVDNHYIINSVSDESRMQGWLAVQYVMIALPLGMKLSLALFGYKHNRVVFASYIGSPISPLLSRKDSFIRFPLYLLSFVCLIAVAYTFYVVGEMPIWSVISGGGSSEVFSMLRQDAHRDFQGNQYVRNIFAIGLTPIISFIAFSYWKLTGKLLDKIWFLSMLIASCMILTYDLSKSPLVQYFLGFLFINILINGAVSRKVFFFFFLAALGLVVTAYIFIAQVIDPLTLFSYNSGIGGRIFLSQAAGTYMAFEYFPKHINFLGLTSLSDILSSAFNLENTDRAARLIMAKFNPSAVEEGLAGVMNSLFIAEAWANFGLIGVIIAPIHVGFIIQSLFMLFLKSPKTPLLLGLFAYFSYKGSVTGGFNDYLYNPGYFIFILLFLIIYQFSLEVKKKQVTRE